jgi:hypothetical protein
LLPHISLKKHLENKLTRFASSTHKNRYQLSVVSHQENPKMPKLI